MSLSFLCHLFFPREGLFDLNEGTLLLRDALDASMSYSAHAKFVSRWLDKLELEDKAAEVAVPRTEPVSSPTE